MSTITQQQTRSLAIAEMADCTVGNSHGRPLTMAIPDVEIMAVPLFTICF